MNVGSRILPDVTYFFTIRVFLNKMEQKFTFCIENPGSPSTYLAKKYGVS